VRSIGSESFLGVIDLRSCVQVADKAITFGERVQLIYREIVFELSAPTGVGREYHAAAAVRLGDSSPGGRARLDALARLLQDVADDDARSAGFGDFTWVVRRTVLAVHRFPVYLEPLDLTTWCSGFGAAWAERRISVRGERGGHVESSTLWVHMDGRTMRPSRLPEAFVDVFGPSALGRTVPSKHVLDAPPAGAVGAEWPLRFTDFDVLEHVNNAMYLAPVEQALAERRTLRAPLTVTVEHGAAIERADDVTWLVVDRPSGGFDGWLLGRGRQFAAVSVTAGASVGAG
jgi:acyl-ACP thioesterase